MIGSCWLPFPHCLVQNDPFLYQELICVNRFAYHVCAFQVNSIKLQFFFLLSNNKTQVTNTIKHDLFANVLLTYFFTIIF